MEEQHQNHWTGFYYDPCVRVWSSVSGFATRVQSFSLEEWPTKGLSNAKTLLYQMLLLLLFHSSEEMWEAIEESRRLSIFCVWQVATLKRGRLKWHHSMFCSVYLSKCKHGFDDDEIYGRVASEDMMGWILWPFKINLRQLLLLLRNNRPSDWLTRQKPSIEVR